ncbi:putative tRNA sulfurtransferase [Cocos nucifera]|uniref:Putative tRNA sulfurtransferase n=1 Tax=Cocos nucifera TaxID=13894 RepID=A0A8K0I8V8_COCNU|nr:putative tRNA sulfurtransferase [Cocos nucifera]
MEEEAAILGSDLEEFSASATVVPFDPPLPLLRGPVPAGFSDDPSAGPFVLAFRDAGSWRFAFRATEAKIIEQCEAGARVGCSISASNKCKPPWWKTLFGVSAADFAEREKCEEREVASCLAASKEACIQFAKEKCLSPFRDARIASIDLKGNLQLDFGAPDTAKNISEARCTEPKSFCFDQETSYDVAIFNLETTNYRGSILLEKSAVENS